MCGCYYVPSVDAYNTKKYLPQIELKAHTTVFSTASRTVLSQTFVNPSLYTGIKECKYTFPLYDGVSVVGFTCQVRTFRSRSFVLLALLCYIIPVYAHSGCSHSCSVLKF